MSELPRVVYFGSDEVCLPGLSYLVEQASEMCRLAGVVSQPDRPQGRGNKLRQNPVADYSSSSGIPLLQPEKPDASLAEWIRREGVAVAYVMAYGHFLPKSVREAPLHGMLNFHGSILPAFRGASPIETAIAIGEPETGVCLMQIVREMDAGPVADYERVCIAETDNCPEVRAKVGQAVRPLLERNLEASLKGGLDFKPQNASRASYCRKILKEDAALDFDQPAAAIYARIRAFKPWPGAYFDHGKVRIKVGLCSIGPLLESILPGTVLSAGETLDVATGSGCLRLHELQRPGGRMMPASAFLRGYPIQSGEVLRGVPSTSLLV